MSLREGDQKSIVSGTQRSYSLSILAIVIVGFAIFLVWRHTIGSHEPIGWGVWVYSEWLINYSGGFVRRGLAGEIIARLADGHSAARITTTFVFGMYLILVMLFLLLAMIGRGKNSASAILLSILIPGGLFAMARDNLFYYGKEILFLIGLEVCCLLQLAIFSEWDRRLETVLIWFFLAIVFATALLLPLVHEGYVFFGAPAIFILLYSLTRAYPNKSYLKPLLWVYPVLAVGAFVVAALFKGNASVALAIWNSLSESDRLIIAPLSPSKPCCSLAAIGFGMLHAIAGTKVLLAGGLWFWVFVIGCAFGLLTLITALVYEQDREVKNAARLLNLLVLLFMATLPMYLIGEDWGRWVMIVTMSYLPLLFTVSPRHIPDLNLTGQLSPLISKAIVHRRAVVWIAFLFCLTFSYPEWGYFPGQSSNPLSFIFAASQRLFHSITPGASWVDTINHQK